MQGTVALIPVEAEEMQTFEARLQEAFTADANVDDPTFEGTIPPKKHIDQAMQAPGAEALWIYLDDSTAGGIVVSGDDSLRVLEFIFVSQEMQGKHVGFSAWQALEARYPETRVWELMTPYYQKRNVHFYVNKCGFQIVEYLNDRHFDPHYPQEDASLYPHMDDGLLRFQKVMG